MWFRFQTYGAKLSSVAQSYLEHALADATLKEWQDAGKDVGDITVPPKYTSADFLKYDFWRLRGKLDVPNVFRPAALALQYIAFISGHDRRWRARCVRVGTAPRRRRAG